MTPTGILQYNSLRHQIWSSKIFLPFMNYIIYSFNFVNFNNYGLSQKAIAVDQEVINYLDLIEPWTDLENF